MNHYYTAIIWLCVFALIAALTFVARSSTLTRRNRVRFALLFSTVAIAAVCEWTGVLLQNTGSATRVLHIAVKVIELSLAPCTCLFLAWILDARYTRLMMAFFAVHAALELLSGFFGFIFSVDDNSYYAHERFYWIYIAAYFVSILYMFFFMFKGMKNYQYAGHVNIILICLFLFTGILVQFIHGEIRVVYLAITISSILMYVFSLEMVQQTDRLSGLINRWGFETYTQGLDFPSVIVFFDIDKFKSVNDEYGHVFGDKCLGAIGYTIKHVYARYGKCFRYGGDEFCVVLRKNFEKIDALNRQFCDELENIRVDGSSLPVVSIGYSYFDPELGSIQSAIALADEMMYRQKREHEAPSAVSR